MSNHSEVKIPLIDRVEYRLGLARLDYHSFSYPLLTGGLLRSRTINVAHRNEVETSLAALGTFEDAGPGWRLCDCRLV